MKKLLLVGFLCFALAGITKAQTGPVFTLGPKLGINHHNILADKSSVRKEGILGYQAGVFVRAGLLKTYIQPEAYYNFKSTTVMVNNTSDGSTSYAGNLKFHNLDVPVLLGSHIINAKAFNIRIFAGPMVSFLLKSEYSTGNYNPDNYDFKNKIWGGQAGIGFDIGNVTVDIRYQTKLSKINKLIPGTDSMLHFSAGFKLF